jgi:hypothetical protein
MARPLGWLETLAIPGVLCLAVACNEAPAREALQAAEQALAAAPELQSYAPQEYQAIRDALEAARLSQREGRYTDALRAALPLPDRIAVAARAAQRRKQEAAAEWETLAQETQSRLTGLRTRLDALAVYLPEERLQPARDALAALEAVWTEAQGAEARGDLGQAVEQAHALGPGLDALARRLAARPAPPAAAPAPGPAPSGAVAPR